MDSRAAARTAVAQAREIPGTAHKSANGAEWAPSGEPKARSRLWNRGGPIPGVSARVIQASRSGIELIVEVLGFGRSHRGTVARGPFVDEFFLLVPRCVRATVRLRLLHELPQVLLHLFDPCPRGARDGEDPLR